MANNSRTATTRQVAQANQSTLVDVLRRRGPMTLQQLRETTGLSSATVTRLVDRLRRDGVVLHQGVERSTGGRPPQLIAFNARRHSVLGIDVGGRTIDAAIVDLDGQLLYEHVVPTHADDDRGGAAGDRALEVFDRIAETSELLIRKAGELKCPVRAVGVGVPGAVRSDSDVVQFAPSLGWWDMPLRRMLRERVRLPVVVENDVNLLAVAEHARGAGRSADDLLVIALGTGVGAALILNGRLYRGHQGGAGEIGYYLLETASLDREWPGFGDLESRVADLQQQIRVVTDNRLDTFGGLLASSDEAQRLLAELAGVLSLICANSATLLSPRRVVFGGALGRALGEHLVPLVSRALHNRVPWQPEFAVARIERAELLGAAQLASELAVETGAS